MYNSSPILARHWMALPNTALIEETCDITHNVHTHDALTSNTPSRNNAVHGCWCALIETLPARTSCSPSHFHPEITIYVEMDPSSQALRKVRDEVIESRAWSKLQRELLMQIHHLEYLAGEGQLRTFNSLTTREKLAAVERAVKELGDTPAYAKLQTKIGAAVDQHFSSLVFNPLAPPQTTQQATSSSSVHVPSRAGRDGEQQASSFNRPLAEACSILLQESPHLKHSLKNALNHPLPSTLRLPAWKLLLQYPAVQKDFMVTAKNMQPRNAEERAISERCQSILSSHLVFRDIAEGDTNLLAMQSVMLYWKQRTSVSVLDSEFLLCVPFIHVWREELDRQVGEGKGEGWLLFAEIAGEYVNFMEMLPPSIGSAVGRVSFGEGFNSNSIYMYMYKLMISL